MAKETKPGQPVPEEAMGPLAPPVEEHPQKDSTDNGESPQEQPLDDLGLGDVMPQVLDQVKDILGETVLTAVNGGDTKKETAHGPITGVFKGPFDFEAFELGKCLDELSVYQLKEQIKGKNEACRILQVVISWYNHTAKQYLNVAAENAELKLKIDLLEEKQGRSRETGFGQKSERRSALEGTAPESQGTPAESPDGETGNAGAQAAPHDTGETGAPEEPQDKDKEKEKEKGKEKAEEKKKEGKEEGEEGEGEPEKGKKKRPKRQPGCGMNSVTKDAIHLPLSKTFSEEELEKLRQGGQLRKLPDGSYTMVVILSLPVVIEVSYERYQNIGTKEIYNADSAAEGKMLPKSLLTTNLFSFFLYQRVVLGIPTTRLLKLLEAANLKFQKQTFYNWFIQYAIALARPMVMRMLEIVLENGKAQTDETWTRIREDLKKEGRRNSVLWLIRTSERLQIPPIVVVRYTGSRASKEFADIIRGYALKLMSDGYSGYSALLEEFADQIELVGCLQHARSRFVDVIQALKGKGMYKAMSDEERKNLPVNRILDRFADVFKAEQKMDTDASYEVRKAYRDSKVLKALNKLFELIEEEHAKLTTATKGYMRDALEYAMKYKTRFYAAVSDPDMPIHNTASERAFAKYAVLRNNYKQLDTVLGAEAMCLWFSIFQTAKENGVNEQVYIDFLLENLKPLLEEHGDYHQLSLKAIKEMGMDGLPTYQDLRYLDELLPYGERFKKYVELYQEKKLKQIVDLSDAVKKAQLAG